MMQNSIVSRDEWLAARKALLARELMITHELDALRAERRQLPWVRIDVDYQFEGQDGPCRLADLFGDKSQLAVYHFMLSPGSDHICPGCAFTADNIDAARQHFEQADLAFAAISRADVQTISSAKARMGWTFNWVSSAGSDFNADFGVTFTEAERNDGSALYNYGKTVIKRASDMFGVSIFFKDDKGVIYHTYSTYHRGTELLMGAFNWLDLTPKGRNEVGGIMSWVRLHDEY